jgi:glycogen debranching enzyme
LDGPWSEHQRDRIHPHCPRGCIAQAWSVAEILNLAKLAAEHPRRRR